MDDPETSLYDRSITTPEADGTKTPRCTANRIALADIGSKFPLIDRLYGFGYEAETFTGNVSPKEIKAYSPSAMAVSYDGNHRPS